MTALEKMKAWLMTCPCLSQGFTLETDHTAAASGSAGLYPCGLEEISRREDVLGNIKVTNKLHFVLYQVSCGEPDEQAGRLLALQNWVQQQCLAGLAPHFGDVPGEESVRAEHGKLKSVSPTGTRKHELKLTVQFVTIFERSR